MLSKNFIPHIRAIFKREITGYFGSPVAFVFIAVFLLLLGFFTFYVSRLFEMGQADLRGFFEWHPWVYLFLVPAVAMRLWAEERRMGTLELILTLPVTVTEAILGKFLAAWAFIGAALMLTFPTVLTVIYLGDPDMGAIFCGYTGSLLMAGAFLSVGSMTSSLTRSQVISFIIAVVICLFFNLAGFPPINNILAGWAPLWLADGIANLGFLPHFSSLQRGILDLRDIVYFLSIMIFMLFANTLVIQNRRS
ncbi:MAG: ABC transporter permease [Desulfobacterales bacterium]|nr:MAG: ABC transporter permease [Desulfobacterales bacterium]